MIALENVTKTYGQFSLHCTMEVKKGMVTGIIGKNGAGKTTLFKLILGLIPSQSGTIVLFGEPLSQAGAKARRRIGVVLAESGFNDYMTISSLLPMLRVMYPEFQTADFTQKCQEHSLPMNKKIKEFSTGMKRKLHVLAAVSHNADLLILDEPTTGLDVVAREDILKLLWDYMENGQRSILISSHISSDLEGICDDFYLIDDGKLLLHEATHNILDHYALIKVTEDQMPSLEKKYILRQKKEPYGYSLLTNMKSFYRENYPDIAIEKGGLDELMMMIVKGEAL